MLENAGSQKLFKDIKKSGNPFAMRKIFFHSLYTLFLFNQRLRHPVIS
jgi:hypothetical protein